MSYGFSGVILPAGYGPGQPGSYLIRGFPIAQAESEFNIPLSQILEVANRRNLDVASLTSVVKIELRNGSGELTNDRITFTVDASAVMKPGQAFKLMRLPRGRLLSAGDVGEAFLGKAGQAVWRASSELPLNATAAGVVDGASYTLQSFDGASGVLSDGQGGTATVTNGDAADSWVDILSDALPLAQRGTMTALGGNIFQINTPCSHFLFSGEGTGGGGAVGDPYVLPVDGGVVKLRSEPQSYRMWSDQRAGGRLVVNARVDFLRPAEYAEAERAEAARGARHGGMGDQAAFLRFLFVDSGGAEPPLCVDLERLAFVRPAGGRGWDAAARAYALETVPDPAPWAEGVRVERRRNAHLPSGVWNRDDRIQRAYGQIRTQSLELVLRSEVYGEVRVVCSRFPDDPSVRTSVHVPAPCVGPSGAEGVLVGRTTRRATLRRLDDRRVLPADWHDKREGRVGHDSVRVRGGPRSGPQGGPQGGPRGDTTVRIRYVKA